MKKPQGMGDFTAWEKPSKRKNHSKDEKIASAFSAENSVLVIQPKLCEDTAENKKHKRRVAAYCRVSTDDENQTSSYELQINYYKEYIERTPDWELAGIYADRGLSGTAMKNRTQLLLMLEDCRQGKIDHIITKSVARFSRNVIDCFLILDELLSLKPPVEVDFEVDGINSKRDRFETDLFMSSYVAQNESVKKSKTIKWAWQIRFSKGLALVPTHSILGFDKDKNGNIVIVAKEAKIVRYIYNNYLHGYTKGEIAKALTLAKIPTVKGNAVWSTTAIHSILSNEKYVGDALMQKTFTPNCLDHKAKTNKGELPQYYKKNHHVNIIERSAWDETQRQLKARLNEKTNKLKRDKKFIFRPIKTGNFADFYIIPMSAKYKRAEKFIDEIKKERGQENAN